MKWTLASRRDLEPLLELVREKEWRHTFFSCRMIKKGRPVLPAKDSFPIAVLKGGGRIHGALMITRWGSLFPLFPENRIPCESQMDDLYKWVRSYTKRVYSLMGTDDRITPLYRRLGEGRTVSYDLMVRKGPLPPLRRYAELPGFHRASVETAPSLIHLEMGYQREEVFLEPDQIDRMRIYHNLKETLRVQKVFYLTIGGAAVAKGGTNAQGFKWNQIGGVYTEPTLRGRGYSTFLLNRTIETLESENKSTVLFVKENNGSARRVYEKLGFTKEESFKIIYYL